MTRLAASPEFDPRVADWLEGDPDRAPEQVLTTVLAAFPSIPQRPASRLPWRPDQMNRYALGAAAVISVVLVGVVLMILRPSQETVGGPSPAPTTASSVPPPVAVGPLAQSFSSIRHLYEISYPSGWTVTQGTAPWQPGTRTGWGDPALDVIQGSGARLVASSQALAKGDTPDLWLVAYCELQGGNGSGCPDYGTKWSRIPIGNQSGFVTLDGVPAAGGTIKLGGPIFDAVVVANGRGYEFTLDGDVDRSAFERLMASVNFGPVSSRVENLSRWYQSTLYGYSMYLDPSWTVTPALTRRTGPLSQDTLADDIQVAGTDTGIGGSASPLGNRTWDELLAQLRTITTPNVPPGCDGGDPSTWPTVPVGNKQGRVQQLCNAAIVYVLSGKTVYEFDWGNSTFNAGQHLEEIDFLHVLKGVVFPASDAAVPGASTAPSTR